MSKYLTTDRTEPERAEAVPVFVIGAAYPDHPVSKEQIVRGFLSAMETLAAFRQSLQAGAAEPLRPSPDTRLTLVRKRR